MNLAHGTGDRHDLPLPLDLLLQGGAIALLTSFLALGLLWKAPRFTPLSLTEPRDRTWPRLLVLVPLVLIPLPYLVFVVLWVGVAFASILLGPVWRVLNPLRLVLRFSRNRPYRLGYWPAAVQLLAFAWVELVAPSLVLWFVVLYVIVNVVGGVLCGAKWFENADGFEVYSSLLGRLSPLGGNPFRKLLDTPTRGLTAVVVVCLGSTAFDSIGATAFWKGLGWPGTLGLLLAVAVVAGTFALVGKASLAHTLIPIVAGYIVAHYHSLLFKPMVTVSVAAVLIGHIVAVVAAHDRTLALTPQQRHLTDQVPLLLLMVGYTTGGLALLAAG